MQSGKLVLFYLLTAFWLLPPAASGQTAAVLSGYVKTEAGVAIPGATVSLKNTTYGTTCNAGGFYSFTTLKPGTYTMTCSAIGYRYASKEITLRARQPQTADFNLKENQQDLAEVQVFGKTETQQVKEQGFTVNAIETKQFANTTADMNQVLNRTTGIRVREQGGLGSDFNFSINGLSGRAVKFFIDGIPLEVMGSAMSLNNVPVNLAERVEVYKGVVPVSLGSDALGGSVNLVTNQGISKYLDASYSVGSFNTHRVALTGQSTHARTGLIIKASAFYNYSDNNYIMRGVEVWDPEPYAYVKRDLRRFHDNYQSVLGQLEVGITNKKWADVFFVGGSYSTTAQDIQTGTRQDVIYGGATRNGYAYNASMRYRKDNLFTKGLNVNAFIARSVDHYEVVDTTGYKYAWDGSRVRTNQGEISAVRSITIINRPRTFARANLSYELNPNHSFNLNYTFDHVRNEAYNQLIEDHDGIPGLLGKHILGVAYQQNGVNGRLTNTFFGKYYGLSVEQKEYVSVTGQYGQAKNFLSNYGYGLASRFKLGENAGLKASYEQAYRLQDVGELFGNGFTVIANPTLKPESSQNVNAGGYWGKRINRHRLFAEASWFYRDAKDFIYAVVYQSNSSVSRYENTSKVRVNGVEAEVRYDYDNLINASVNGSYQNAINNTRSAIGSTTGTPEATYLNRIPNQPWAFGNADLSIGKNDVWGKDTRLQFNWNAQYVHWFYLTWEAYGSKASKNKVPDQFIQNASLSYSLKRGMYNLSLESRNLTNSLAYDNFRLQKPGRVFAVKLRYFIR